MDGQQTNSKPSGPPDEYQAASQATGEYSEYEKHAAAYQQKAPRHRVRKLLIILAAVVVVAGLGFAAYWFLIRDTAKNPATDNAARDLPAQTSPTNQTDEITTKTEHYVSAGFMLEFDHPEDWEITEQTGEGKLEARSPAMQLKTTDGSGVTGQVVFMIRDKQQALPEFDKGNAQAALKSEKIAYTKPSSVQRGSTYLSFLQYAGSSSGLDGMYITGDTGYQAEQAIPKADLTPVDPVISVTFVGCTDASCGSGTAVTLSEGMWQDASFATPLKNIFKSLIIN